MVFRCQAGDEEAFTRLFERHCGPVKYYLRRMLGSVETAEDVSQGVWLNVLRGIRGLKRLGAFRTWLYTIARREALSQLEREGRVTAADDETDPETLPDDAGDEFSADDAEAVHAALDKLSAVHREALVLRYIEDMSYEEIAAVTGCGLGTVRSRIHYAKGALRRLMEEADDGR